MFPGEGEKRAAVLTTPPPQKMHTQHSLQAGEGLRRAPRPPGGPRLGSARANAGTTRQGRQSGYFADRPARPHRRNTREMQVRMQAKFRDT